MTAILGRILEAEHGILIIVGEGLRVSAPAHDGTQALLGGFLAHEVLQFVDKAAFSRGMRCALIQYAANMSGQRHIIEQVAHENALALIERSMGKGQSILRQLDIAALQLRKAQHLQGFCHGKQLVDLHLQI